MKKIAFVLAGLVVLLALLLVAPSLVNWNRYRGEIGTRLEAVVHRQVTIAGPIGLHLLPSPALTVADVSVANISGAAPGPMARIGRLDLNLALLPLVTGRVEVTSLTIDHPVLNLQRLADGRANWQFTAPSAPGREAAKTLSKPVTPATPVAPAPSAGASAVPAVAIRSLSVTGGQVTYRAAKGAPVTIAGINARLSMASGLDGPVTAHLSTLVQGTPLDVTAALGAQVAGKRALSANVASPALGTTVSLTQGTLTLAGAVPAVSGRLAVSLPAPGRLMARLGKPAILPGVGPVSLTAALDADAKTVTLSNLTLAAAPVNLTGQVGVALSGKRPVIDADLSGNAIDVGALMGVTQTGWLWPRTIQLPTGLRSPPVSVAVASDGRLIPAAVTVPAAGAHHWSRTPIDLSALRLVDARATVKLQSLRWKKWLVEGPAAHLTLTDGTLDLTRLSGHVLGGSVIVALRLANGTVPRLSGSLAVAGADLGKAGFGNKTLALTNGLLNTSLRFSAAGNSVAALVGSLGGDGSYRVVNGVLTGFDLPAVSKRVMAVKKPADIIAFLEGGGLMGGTTDFSSLAGTLRAANGVIVTRDTKLVANGGTAATTARIDLPAWRMQARADVHLAALNNAPPLGIVLDGPLDNPRKTVDAGALGQFLAERGLHQLLKNKAGSQLDKVAPGAGQVLQNLFKGLGGQ